MGDSLCGEMIVREDNSHFHMSHADLMRCSDFGPAKKRNRPKALVSIGFWRVLVTVTPSISLGCRGI